MRTNRIQTAILLLSMFTAAAASGCAAGAGDAEEGAGTDGEGAFVGEASQALTLCSDGIYSPSELCYSGPVEVLDVPNSGDAIAVGRLDAGTALDFVVASALGDQIRIKLGNGSGGFPSAFQYTMGNGPTDVAIGDFNGDGLKDILATVTHEDRVRVRWGGGSPRWGSFSSFAVGDSPLKAAVGDLNGDGRDDVVSANGANNYTVRLGAAGGLGAPQGYASSGFNINLRLADCDADGDLDLLYTDGLDTDLTFKARKNNGAGAFGAPIALNLGVGSSGFAHSLTVGDWNEDGIQDVVVALSEHKMVRLLGAGGCTFGSKATAATGLNPVEIESADMNLDGNRDLVIAHHSTAEISIYLGHGNGDFSPPEVIATPDAVLDLGVGDFNSDGLPDIVFSGWSGAYLVASDP
ncbi:VCBS repeat-containing protein [Sorangium sp. So ce136]|uniref:FG-GAP repeat domain-containing protein n=1 Tax=Sorangium sp. So ce136 TaxID=3133284 RepID=UPI003EFF2214